MAAPTTAPRDITAGVSIEDQPALTPAEKRHLQSLERKIDRGLQTFREVGEALMEVRDSRLYRETHASFESYCGDRWQLSRDRAYQLIGAVEVVHALGDPESITNEAQARELVPLMREDPEALKTVWARVQDRTIEGTGHPVTATMIRQVKAEVLAPTPSPRPATDTERVVNLIERTTAAIERWTATKPKARDRRAVGAALSQLTAVAP